MRNRQLEENLLVGSKAKEKTPLLRKGGMPIVASQATRKKDETAPQPKKSASLPNIMDATEQILSFLDGKSLLKARLVSQYYNKSFFYSLLTKQKTSALTAIQARINAVNPEML